MVHGDAEGRAVGALEERVKCCSDRPGTGSEEQDWRSANCDAPWRNRAGAPPESFGSAKAWGTRRDFPWHCGGPVDPTDCPWPWTGAVDCEPGDQAQRRQPTLPCQPGGQERVGTGAASQVLSPGAPQGATMACGAEARAAMVTGADLWLAEAGVPDRPRDANISRSDLSQSLRSDARRAEKAADGALAHQTSDAPPQKPQRREWTGTHPRYGLHPPAARRRRGSCRAGPLGTLPSYRNGPDAH